MNTFTMQLCIPATCLPVAYVRALNAKHPECPPIEAGDTVDDVNVNVDYKSGWFKPGRISGPPDSCYPDEGEDPEIVSVVIDDDGFKSGNILEMLPEKLIDKLVSGAWEHQNGQESYEPDEPDYDDAVDYNYDPY